jgi:flagellar biosynthesis protein FlhG
VARLFPIASGKGGVGKSVIAANLALALARSGRTVVLVDLDLGGSNLHTFLGIKNAHAGIGALAWKQERSLSALLVESGYERLWFVPGDGLLPGTANLDWSAKRRIIKELGALPADFVVLDLGAGSSYNVVDFFLASSEGLLVLRPELTSVLNAYAFLKTTAFRALSAAFPNKSAGREAVERFAAVKNEGAGISFLDFARELAGRYAGGGLALDALSRLRPRGIMNMGHEPGDAELGYRLRDIAARNLGLGLGFSAFLPDDPSLPPSIARRRPLLDSQPEAPFSRGIAALCSRLSADQGENGDSLGELATRALMG